VRWTLHNSVEGRDGLQLKPRKTTISKTFPRDINKQATVILESRRGHSRRAMQYQNKHLRRKRWVAHKGGKKKGGGKRKKGKGKKGNGYPKIVAWRRKRSISPLGERSRVIGSGRVKGERGGSNFEDLKRGEGTKNRGIKLTGGPLRGGGEKEKKQSNLRLVQVGPRNV